MLTSAVPVPINGQAPPSPTALSTLQAVVAPAAAQVILASQQAAAAKSLVQTSVSSSYHHIWLVTGPAGCGKSTIGEYLANTLEIPYIEGDKFHPKTNVDKMANGIALTDADRWDWLTILREECTRQLESGDYTGVVLTCSALKKKYRDVLRVAGYYDHNLLVHFIYLDAPESIIMGRVAARQNHFMGANMVHSQFDALEPPKADETDVIRVDVARPIDEVKRDALAKVISTMEAH